MQIVWIHFRVDMLNLQGEIQNRPHRGALPSEENPRKSTSLFPQEIMEIIK